MRSQCAHSHNGTCALLDASLPEGARQRASASKNLQVQARPKWRAVLEAPINQSWLVRGRQPACGVRYQAQQSVVVSYQSAPLKVGAAYIARRCA